MTCEAEYVSVWDGGREVVTRCRYDAEKREASEIGSAADDGAMDYCEREFIRLEDGTEIDTFQNADTGEDYVDGEVFEGEDE